MRYKVNFKDIITSSRFSYLLVVVWMSLIFFMSHQDATASSNLSSGLTAYLAKGLTFLTRKEDIDFTLVHFLARKSAHFTAYFVLGLLIYRAMAFLSFRHGLYSLGLSIVYAMSDEFHQTFVFGRSGELRDVLIDTTGALLGIILYHLIKQSNKNKRQLRKITEN